MIAILALFLSFSETLGKGAQTEATTANIEASDLWAFFQAKEHPHDAWSTPRPRQMTVAAQGADRSGRQGGDAKADRRLAEDRRALRFRAEDQEGRKELAERAKEAEEERDLSMAKYHHYELASAAFQIGIVLASAAVITGMVVLAWCAGALGVVGARACWRSAYSRRTRCRFIATL